MESYICPSHEFHVIFIIQPLEIPQTLVDTRMFIIIGRYPLNNVAVSSFFSRLLLRKTTKLNWQHCLNLMFEWSDHSFISLYIVLYTFHAGFRKIAHETHTFMCDWVSKTLLERLLVCLIWLIWCSGDLVLLDLVVDDWIP